MIHSWDQQILRLCRRVDKLEEENAKLREMLMDAIRICDEPLAAGVGPLHPEEPAHSSSRVAKSYRSLMPQRASMQLRLPWRSVTLVLGRLLLPRRRQIESAVGWPFEPVVDWRRSE